MFARRPAVSTGPQTAPSAPTRSVPGALMAAVSNPFVSAGAAAALFLGGLATLVLVTADPKAGSPFVRMKLDDRVAAISTMKGPGGFNVDGLRPSSFVDGAADANAPGGQAVFTLPQGASVVGGPTPAFVRNPGASLPAAPIAGLTTPSPAGPLPIIGRDGRTPFQAYARPFTPNGKPRVALVVGGLGLNAAATKAAIERLPPEITLSFVAYADGLQGWIDLARADGHEVLLEIPMEPLDQASNDPGPYALMANAESPETVRRLEWLLARATGYFGVTNYLGGRFLTAEGPMNAFMNALRQRGLGFIDDGAAARKSMIGLSRASADAVVDADLSSESIQKQLISLEGGASQHGSALGSAFAYPVTLEVVSRWAQGLAARGYQLAPASAVIRR